VLHGPIAGRTCGHFLVADVGGEVAVGQDQELLGIKDEIASAFVFDTTIPLNWTVLMLP
jgi:hypothetical protein